MISALCTSWCWWEGVLREQLKGWKLVLWDVVLLSS